MTITDSAVHAMFDNGCDITHASLHSGDVISVHAGTSNPDSIAADTSGFTICKVGL